VHPTRLRLSRLEPWKMPIFTGEGRFQFAVTDPVASAVSAYQTVSVSVEHGLGSLGSDVAAAMSTWSLNGRDVIAEADAKLSLAGGGIISAWRVMVGPSSNTSPTWIA